MGQRFTKTSRRDHLRSRENSNSETTVRGALNVLFQIGDSCQQERCDEYCQRVTEWVQMGDRDGGDRDFLQFLQDAPALTTEERDCIASYSSERGLTPFHYIVQHRAIEVVEILVDFCKDGCDAINAKTREPDVHASTPLHYAVSSGNLQLVQALLKHPHIDLDVKDVDGCTPLHYACHFGFADIVIALKRADFCIANNEKNYPLHIAASERRKEIFFAIKSDEELMEKLHTDQFTSLKDAERNTLLHLAIDAEMTDAVDLCLMLGFDLRKGNKLKMNSLHVAARRGNVAIAQKLLVKEAEIGEDLKTFVNSPNQFCATPLYVAAKFNQVKVIEMLLTRGAEIEAPNCLGFTPLLAAIRYTNRQCVRALLSAGASIVARDNKRHYNALLWAVEVQRQDLVKIILVHAEKKAELSSMIWREKDHYGNTAHHLAAKARNLNILETLVEMNANCLEEKNKEGYTPFHIAMGEGKPRIVKFIISHSADSIYSLDRDGNTGLHLAAEHGHKAIVERLVTVHDFGTSMSTRNNCGHTPLHQAAKNGHWEVLAFLMRDSPLQTIEILDCEHATALYLACQNGHPKCVEVLLQWNALVTYCHEDKERGMQCKRNCLTVAIDNNHHQVVSVILKSEHWRQALQYHCDPGCGETPLRKLIKTMPGAAKLAFDRCITDRTHTLEKQIDYNYEFLEDFRDLFQDEGPKFSQSPYGSGTMPFFRKFLPVISHDAIVQAESDEPGHKTPSCQSVRQEHPPTPCHFQHSKLTAQPCVPFHNWGPKEYQHKNHPLCLMLQYNRQDLLKHDLVASFIHCKWNWFGRYVYYPNIILYIVLMLTLTIYMHLRFEYSKELSSAVCLSSGNFCSIDDESFKYIRNCTFSDYNVTDQGLHTTLYRKKIGIIVCAIVVGINCFVRVVFELFQIYYRRQLYFTSFINYLEIFLYFTTIIFVCDIYLTCLQSWQWQLGSICIFLSWIHFIIFLREQPMVGIYVVMFQVIIKTFLRILPMSILLILAFGQPFYMLLSTVISKSPQQFITFPYSLLKTIIMTAGEFEVDHILFSTPSVVEYPVATYFLWIIFLIIMPILLHNLLVGLAVNDIKRIQEKAALQKQSLQIEFILSVLSFLPKPVIRCLNKRKYTQTWGKRWSTKFQKWLSGEAWKPEINFKSGDEVSHKLELVTESVTNLEYRMHSLFSEQTAKLERLMVHFNNEQELYLEPAQRKLLSRDKSHTSFSHSSPNFASLEENFEV